MRRALLPLAGLWLSACLASAAQAAVITVGSGGSYARLSDAIANAQANDEIQVAAGLYADDFATITVPLTIVGVGGLAVLQQVNAAIPNEKAILVTRADVTIRNLEFRDARVPDGNGAGIRHEVGDLTIIDSVFRNNQDGILAGNIAGADILVRGTSFIGNGAGDGQTHALYVNRIDSLTVEQSIFDGTLIGHDIKSRAAVTTVLDSILDDGVTGTASYAIDLSNGGVGRIIGNTITQGANTDNPSMIAYGPEGDLYSLSSLLVQNNTFINLRPGSSVGVANFTQTVSAQLCGNTFQNVATPLSGPGQISSQCDDPGPGPDPGPDPGPTPVPAPGGLALFGLALGGLALLRRSRVHRA